VPAYPPTEPHLDFGLAESLLVGPRDNEVYLVRFFCGCVGVIARGRMMRRSGAFTLVCPHVATATA
jgi:hypothetical protein